MMLSGMLRPAALAVAGLLATTLAAAGEGKTPGYNHKIPEKIMTPDAVEARVQGALDQLAEARAQAVEAAEAARVAGVISAFLIAATLLSAAAASYFAAVMGGDHRDRNITFRSLR